MKQKGQKAGLVEDTVRFLFRQLAEAMVALHGQLICHRDIKLENILVSDRRRIKLIDVGFSIRCKEDAKLQVFCGTSSYMAPEIVTKKEYSGFKADIWALGVVLYVMLTGRFPFTGKNERELFNRIQTGQFLPPVQMNFEAKRLVTRMLSVDPSKRPSAGELVRDQWLMTGLGALVGPNMITFNQRLA